MIIAFPRTDLLATTSLKPFQPYACSTVAPLLAALAEANAKPRPVVTIHLGKRRPRRRSPRPY